MPNDTTKQAEDFLDPEDDSRIGPDEQTWMAVKKQRTPALSKNEELARHHLDELE